MVNIVGEIQHCGCYHDEVSIQICTKKGTSRSSQANLWLPYQHEIFSHSSPHSKDGIRLGILCLQRCKRRAPGGYALSRWANMDYWIQMDGNILVSLSSTWDAISLVTKKVSHVLHLASTSISSLRHMSAYLGQSSMQTRSHLHW